MAQPWYATREQVKSALNVAETARNNGQVDRAIAAASRSIETQCHRKFHPYDGTRYLGYPRRDGNSSWRIWLDGDTELVSVSALTSGGTTISSSDYFLEPINVGPPYTSIEINQSSTATFAAGETFQRSIAITGTFGYWDEQEAVGTLDDTLAADATDTASITWTNPRAVGVGSILKIDSERIIVTERSFVDSTQDTSTTLAASASDVTIPVVNGTGYFVGEAIRIDAERMLVVDISGNDLVVKRAWDGSVLATHSSSTSIYGLTGIEIARAQLGSVLAAHTASDVVYRYVVPPLINDLCVAEATTQLQAEIHGYGPKEGNNVTGGLKALRDQAYGAFGRKARHAAI